MDFKDYYKILGIEPDADAATIKKVYRKLARKYHPDVSKEKDAEAKFKEVAEAYEVLKDDAKRAEYDEIRKYGTGGQPFQPPPNWSGRQSAGSGDQRFDGDFSDFFSTVFGAGADGRASGFSSGFSANQKGQDVETDFPVLLEDTLSGASQQISYSLPHRQDDGRITEVRKTLNVKIPTGVVDGERIRLKAQGAQGVGQGASGDLYLRIRFVPHPLYDVDKYDLILTLPLAPWEAVLGTKVVVPTLTGNINLTVPANSQTGKRMRIKGKGLSQKDGFGDLYAVVKIVVPDTTNDELSSLWRDLAEKADFAPRADWGISK